MKVKHLLVNELYRFGQFKRWRFSGIPLYMYVHTVEKGHEVGNSLLHLALFRDFYGSVYAVYNHNTRVSIDVIIGGKYFFEMVNVNTMGVDNVFCFLQLCIIRLHTSEGHAFTTIFPLNQSINISIIYDQSIGIRKLNILLYVFQAALIQEIK